jgi:hypothetical protein
VSGNVLPRCEQCNQILSCETDWIGRMHYVHNRPCVPISSQTLQGRLRRLWQGDRDRSAPPIGSRIQLRRAVHQGDQC